MLTATARPRLNPRDDDGQVMLLVIAFAVIAATLIAVGIDVSAVFLARRSLSSVADSAALDASQALDRSAFYGAGGGACGSVLPVDPAAAQDRADAAVADDAADLHRQFARLDPPTAAVGADGGTVTVTLSGDANVPFGHVLGVLDPRLHDGTLHVRVTSHARSPLTVPGGC